MKKESRSFLQQKRILENSFKNVGGKTEKQFNKFPEKKTLKLLKAIHIYTYNLFKRGAIW
jgi:hypothetical protein